MDNVPIIGKAPQNPLDGFNLKMTRKDCRKGWHAHWEEEVNNDEALVERCVVCGLAVKYNKEGGKMDEAKYMENHKIDFLQPYLSDGNPNPYFFKYYGNPEETPAIIT